MTADKRKQKCDICGKSISISEKSDFLTLGSLYLSMCEICSNTNPAALSPQEMTDIVKDYF